MDKGENIYFKPAEARFMAMSVLSMKEQIEKASTDIRDTGLNRT